MGLFTPDMNNLRELYRTMLQRSLDSERQIVEDGLPAMIENSTNSQLKNAFRTHLEESRSTSPGSSASCATTTARPAQPSAK